MSQSKGLENQLIRLFAEQLHVEVPSVETDLIDTGLVDSLTFVEFLAQLEAGFGVRVSLEDTRNRSLSHDLQHRGLHCGEDRAAHSFK